MLRRSLGGVRLVLTLQARAYFPHVYLAVAVVTVAAFRLAVPEEWWTRLLPPLLLGEQGVVALTLVAAQIYLERNEGSVAALAVTPLRSAEYVAALVVASSVLPCLSRLILWAGLLGFDSRAVLVVAPLFLLSLLSGLLGLAVTGRFFQFTTFLLGGSVPAAGLLILPALSYFEIVPRWVFAWLPSDSALYAFAALTASQLDMTVWLRSVVVLLLFCCAAFPLVARVYRGRIRYRLDPAHE